MKTVRKVKFSASLRPCGEWFLNLHNSPASPVYYFLYAGGSPMLRWIRATLALLLLPIIAAAQGTPAGTIYGYVRVSIIKHGGSYVDETQFETEQIFTQEAEALEAGITLAQ